MTAFIFLKIFPEKEKMFPDITIDTLMALNYCPVCKSIRTIMVGTDDIPYYKCSRATHPTERIDSLYEEMYKKPKAANNIPQIINRNSKFDYTLPRTDKIQCPDCKKYGVIYFDLNVGRVSGFMCENCCATGTY